MATAVEWFHYPRAGTGAQEWDYLIGEDVFVPGGIRSLENPGAYGNPDHYLRRYTGREDNGGVHINSGIASHAFYLAIEGGRNRTSGITVQGVGRNNREQIENVFYRAFTLLMPATSTFVTARAATARAAQDLYGAGGAVERAVTQAWSAVGVADITRMATLTGTLPAQTYFGPDPRFRLYYYRITMPTTGRYQAVLDWSDSSVDLDIMIGLPGCLSYSCMLTRAESPTRRPEAVCADVRAGEEYWVLFENWSPRPTSYQISQSISNATGSCGTLPGAMAAITSDVY